MENKGLVLRCFQNEPILEAVCELRFVPRSETSGNLLPGMLQAHFGERFPTYQVTAVASIPLALRQQDANLKHAPTSRLMGQEGAINLGDNVVSLSLAGAATGVNKYPGWAQFKALASSLFTVVLNTGLVERAERVSIKYVNLLKSDATTSISALTNVSISFGEEQIGTQPLHLRTEFSSVGHATVVQIAHPADVTTSSGEKLKGMILEVDAVRTAPISLGVTTLDEYLEAAHTEASKVFFRLLSANMTEQYEPIYEPG